MYYRGPPLVEAVEEEWCDEETECRFLDIGVNPEQVHPAIWQSILQRDGDKLRDAIAAIPADEREPTLWLHLAIDVGNEAAAALFMSAGADLEQLDNYHGGLTTTPYRAIHKHRTELVRRMWESTEDAPDPRPGSGITPRNRWLALAAECGHADLVEDMLGWSTDWNYDCALSSAAYNWHYETVKVLARGHIYSQKAIQNALSHACDVDCEDDFEVECCDKSTKARRRELADVIRWLVDAVAKPDDTESASNRWHIVALFHRYPEYDEALKVLLEKGATNVRVEWSGGKGVLVPVR